jgi:hypothetical protein
LHSCWLTLYQRLISVKELTLLLSSWQNKSFPYLEKAEEEQIISLLDKVSNSLSPLLPRISLYLCECVCMCACVCTNSLKEQHLDIQFGLRSSYDELLLASLDKLVTRFGSAAAATVPDWEGANLATPPPITPPSIPTAISFDHRMLYSVIRLVQLPKLASANLFSYFTQQFIDVCGNAKQANDNEKPKTEVIPKESIEFAVAQLCAAHLHFVASAFLLATSWRVNSHMQTVDNLLLFLDTFLARRGKWMEKEGEEWGECRQYCAEALSTLRRDRQQLGR